MPIVSVVCLIIMTECLHCKFLGLVHLSPSDSAVLRNREIHSSFVCGIWQIKLHPGPAWVGSRRCCRHLSWYSCTVQ